MPDEISVSIRFYAAKGGAFLPSQTTTKTLDMAGTHMASFTQEVGTTEEALAIPGDVSGIRHIVVNSLGAKNTNFVELSTASGGGFAAARFAVLLGADCHRSTIPSGVTWYAKADTAAVNIDVRVSQS